MSILPFSFMRGPPPHIAHRACRAPFFKLFCLVCFSRLLDCVFVFLEGVRVSLRGLPGFLAAGVPFEPEEGPASGAGDAEKGVGNGIGCWLG